MKQSHPARTAPFAHAATALFDSQTLAAKHALQKPLHGAGTVNGVVELPDLLEREAPQRLRVALSAKQPPDNGPIWLRLTGPDGVKAFIQEELGL